MIEVRLIYKMNIILSRCTSGRITVLKIVFSKGYRWFAIVMCYNSKTVFKLGIDIQ